MHKNTWLDKNSLINEQKTSIKILNIYIV